MSPTMTSMACHRFIAASLLALTIGAAPGYGQSEDQRLVTAMRDRDLVAVRAFIAEGVGVNAPDAESATPLHWAAHWSDTQAIRLLLEAGADPSVPNRFGVVPLHEAVLQSNPEIVEALLDAGADPNAAFGDGETAVMSAARVGNPDVLRLLLAHGGDPNASEDWHGQTALMWAAVEGHAETARLLIEAGAAVDVASTAHDWIEIEYSAGNVPKARDVGGLTPLHFAARHGSIEVVDILLAAGADIAATEPMYELTPLQMAVVNGHYALASRLIERGAPLDDGSLYLAIDTRNLGYYAQRPNPPEADGDVTNLDLIERLLVAGADPNLAYTKGIPERTVAGTIEVPAGATPLDRAATASDFEAIRVLVEHDADVSIAAEDGVTPLLLTTGYSRARGAPIEDSPERLAAVQALLEAGAKPNAAEPKSGNTALHYAAEAGASALVNLLERFGGNPYVENKDGQTPIELAEGIDFLSSASPPYP